jgi:hypothetical protein
MGIGVGAHGRLTCCGNSVTRVLGEGRRIMTELMTDLGCSSNMSPRAAGWKVLRRKGTAHSALLAVHVGDLGRLLIADLNVLLAEG